MNDPLAPAVHELWSLVVPVAIVALVVGAALVLLARKFETYLRRRRRMARKVAASPSENATPLEGTPHCPLCNRVMVPRMTESGTSSGKSFWGCPAYPDCRGTREIA